MFLLDFLPKVVSVQFMWFRLHELCVYSHQYVIILFYFTLLTITVMNSMFNNYGRISDTLCIQKLYAHKKENLLRNSKQRIMYVRKSAWDIKFYCY